MFNKALLLFNEFFPLQNVIFYESLILNANDMLLFDKFKEDKIKTRGFLSEFVFISPHSRFA